MRILAIGGGSMGRRRLRDLTYLRCGEVSLFEPAVDRCRDVAGACGIRGFTELDEALAWQPQVMTVSTPPALHERYVREAIARRMHVFVELPFVLNASSMEEIVSSASAYPGVLGVSHTVRYYPPFRIIRELLRERAVGEPLYLEYSLGNHIADWHPYEDYRSFYASGALTDGASGADMILHELAAIHWWLGPVASVRARLSKVSALEVGGPDVHDVLLTFRNGCRGYFHHDIIEHGTVGRHVRVVCAEGTVEWHQDQSCVRLYSARDRANRQLAFSAAADWDAAVAASAEMTAILEHGRPLSGRVVDSGAASYSYESNYLREMRHFIDAVRGRHPYTMADLEGELATVRAFHAIVADSRQYHETGVEGNEHVDRA